MINSDISQSKLIVEDMMTTGVITVSPEMIMAEAKEIMRLKNISGLPVVDKEKKLLGIVSIADVIQALDDQNINALVKERMTTKVCSLKPYDSINLALALFRRQQYGRFPVVNDNNQLVGIITPNDIVKRLACFLKLDEIKEDDYKPVQLVDKTRVLEFKVVGADFERAGFAASSLKKNLQELGIKPHIIRRAAIAAYEAEMNVVIHADKGDLKAVISAEKLIIDVEDVGPGIENIEYAMQEGFSTAPDQIREMGFGAGMGLPNIKKSSDFFEIKSTPQKGTKLHIEIFF